MNETCDDAGKQRMTPTKYAGMEFEKDQAGLVVPVKPPELTMYGPCDLTLKEIRSCKVFGFSSDLERAYAVDAKFRLSGCSLFKWEEDGGFYHYYGSPVGGIEAGKRWINGEPVGEFFT